MKTLPFIFILLLTLAVPLLANFSTNTTPLDTKPSIAVDEQTLSLSNGLIVLKTAGITGAQLGGNLSLSGNLLVTGQGNIAGVLYPNTVGGNGQILAVGHNGALQWHTPATGGFDGQYGSLVGAPTLFSGNYADLTGKPTIPTVGSNVAFTDASLTISSDWVNTAHPWSDAEVSDQLTITGGNITGTSFQSSSLSAVHLTVVGAANLNGNLWPMVDGSSGQVMSVDSSGNMVWTSLGNTSTGLELPVLTSGQLTVGNASGVATAVALTGDLSVTSAGIVSVSANAVGAAEVSDSSLTGAKLAPQLDLTNVNTYSGLFVNGQSNIMGVILPIVSGNVGQVLSLGAGGQLTWAEDAVYALATNVITSTQVSDASVGSAQLSANAIDSSKVQDGSLTGSDLSTSLALGGNLSTGGNFSVGGSSNLMGTLWANGLSGSANQILQLSAGGNG